MSGEEEEAPGARRRRLVAALFPGSPTVWRVAGIVGAIGAIVLLVALMIPRDVFTGSNSVRPLGYVVPARLGQPMCVRHVRVPSGTGRVRYAIDTRTTPRPAIAITVKQADGTVIGGRAPPGPAGYHRVDIPLTGEVQGGARDFVLARVCIAPTANVQLFIWGVNGLDQTDPPLVVGKARIYPARVAMWFLPLAHEQASILSRLPQIAERASLFRAGFVGPWLYWLLLLFGFPALAYGAIRLVARGGEGMRIRRVALTLFSLVALYAAGWALVSPTFQAPDESEHFAAVQWFGETGKAVDASQGKRPPWSDSESLLIDATRELTMFEAPDGRAPWLRSYEDAYRFRVNGPYHGHPKRDNGGGFHPATSTWTPLYYATVSPAYLITREHSVASQVLAVRWTGALFGGLTAVFALLTLLTLLPDARRLAIVGGLLLGFLPQFGFVSGAINNDAGVNLFAAIVAYLTILGLRRGFSPGLGALLGLALGVLPLMKGTGYELYPCVALAVTLGLVRRHSRQDLLGVAALGAMVIGVYLGWDALSSVFHRQTFATPGGATPGVSFPAKDHPKEYLSWLWQILVPYRPSFLTDRTLVHWPFFNIYMKRGFGGFGWYAVFFPNWVYGIITLTLATMAAGAGAAILRFRDSARERWVEILFLASVPVVVFMAVEAAYLPLAGLPIDGTAEQGRYAFTALVPLVSMVVAGCLGLGTRRDPDKPSRAVAIATGVLTALLVLGWASWWLVLARFYS